MQRLLARALAVSDRTLFVLTMAWVLTGGLLLQFVVLPYMMPQLHWGHGLIAGLDWTGFHTMAMSQYENILANGWGAWELRPQGQFPAGIASALYVLIRPEPWVVLPVNGALFAAAVVSIRRMLAVIYGSPSMAVIAVLPFFAFASFVTIWGQLHKDVASGAGLCLVLTSLVLARNTAREMVRLPTLSVLTVGGMGLVWLARPYAVFMVLGATTSFTALALFGRGCHRMRLAAVATVVALSALATVGPWTDGKSLEPMTVASVAPPEGTADVSQATAKGDGTAAGKSLEPMSVASVAPLEGTADVSKTTAKGDGTAAVTTSRATPRWGDVWKRVSGFLPRTRRLPPELMSVKDARNYASCAPIPTSQLVDSALFSLCMAREGFKSGGEHGGSNHDYDIRMRSLGDFVAYSPRVVQLSLIEPWPNRWGTEKSAIGRLGGYVIPFEMSAAYLTFVLAIVFAARRLVRSDVWGVFMFCLTYTAFFVYTTPNMGTVYRMRAFPFAIIISLAFGAFLTRRYHGSAHAPGQPTRSAV